MKITTITLMVAMSGVAALAADNSAAPAERHVIARGPRKIGTLRNPAHVRN
jgi:hypothetical protein